MKILYLATELLFGFIAALFKGSVLYCALWNNPYHILSSLSGSCLDFICNPRSKPDGTIFTQMNGLRRNNDAMKFAAGIT